MMAKRSMASGSGASVLGLCAVVCSYIGCVNGSILWMIPAAAFASQAMSSGKRSVKIRQEMEDAEALAGDLPFMVMLRPFYIDNSFSVRNPHASILPIPRAHYEEHKIPITRLLSQAVSPELHLRVLGGEPIGPGVIKTDDSEWRDQFLSLIRDAHGVFVVMLPGIEIPWELHQLRLHGWLPKSVFLLPSRSSTGGLMVDEEAFFQRLKADGLHFPDRGDGTILCKLSEAGGAVEARAFRKLDYVSLRAFLNESGLIPAFEERVSAAHRPEISLAALIKGDGSPTPGLFSSIAVMLLVCLAVALTVIFESFLNESLTGDVTFWLSAGGFFVSLLGTVISFSLATRERREE